MSKYMKKLIINEDNWLELTIGYLADYMDLTTSDTTEEELQDLIDYLNKTN